jgi:hypothetical protein
MPGKVLLVQALREITKRPAILPWLVIALSNLGGVLMYVFVRDLFRDRLVALFALVLYLFVPAKLYFFPLLNTVTPLVVLGCACLTLRWLSTGKAAYAVLLGVALYGIVLYEPLGLVIGLLLAALVARALARADITWRTLLWQSGAVAASFAVAYLVMLLGFHFDSLKAFQEIGADAVAFNEHAERPYSIWVRQNLLDFLFGVGICQALVFWMALGDGLSGPEPWHVRLARPITTLGLALAAVLLATDLIGVNRGEVVRLWIFLACFFQIPTAYVCARLRSRTAMMLVVTTTLLQCALGTSMIGFIQL